MFLAQSLSISNQVQWKLFELVHSGVSSDLITLFTVNPVLETIGPKAIILKVPSSWTKFLMLFDVKPKVVTVCKAFKLHTLLGVEPVLVWAHY